MTNLKFATPDVMPFLYDHFIEPYFPEDEKKPLAHILNMMSRGLYSVLYLCEEDQPVGVAFMATYAEDSQCFLLDYLAVDETKRQNGYGALLLKESLRASHGLPVLIETESPESAENEAQFKKRTKRNHFYAGNGVRKSDVISNIFTVEYNNWVLTNGKDLTDEEICEEIRKIYHFMVPNDRVYEKNIRVPSR